MELKIKTPANTETGKKKLPAQFSEPVRHDIIKRAFEAVQAGKRQAYGADPLAGKRASADLSRRRRKYRGGYGYGVSRMPKKILSRRGRQMYWVGAFAPGTVGGRRAHPPKPEKIRSIKINDKERKKAVRSALAATADKNLVSRRGHKVPQDYPFIISSAFENLSKTKEVKTAFEKLGLKAELARAGKKKVRAGKGKTRGRKYKRAKGPLIVVGGKCNLLKSAKKIPGIDVEIVTKLNAQLLAPGAESGRAALFTEQALEKLAKEKLFQ